MYVGYVVRVKGTLANMNLEGKGEGWGITRKAGKTLVGPCKGTYRAELE